MIPYLFCGCLVSSYLMTILILRSINAQPRNGSFFGPSKGQILLDQLSCDGNELDINNCRTTNWGFHRCNNGNEAGVVCREFYFIYSSHWNLSELNLDIIVNFRFQAYSVIVTYISLTFICDLNCRHIWNTLTVYAQLV